MIWTWKLILLKYLSVTNVACVLLIGELIKPYFTVQPATFNSLFELKFCPQFETRDVINIYQPIFLVCTVSYRIYFFLHGLYLTVWTSNLVSKPYSIYVKP